MDRASKTRPSLSYLPAYPCLSFLLLMTIVMPLVYISSTHSIAIKTYVPQKGLLNQVETARARYMHTVIGQNEGETDLFVLELWV